MRRFVVALLAGLALAACSSTTRDEPEPAYPPITAAPPPAPTGPIAAAPTDACGAHALQSLIGRPRTEAPVPLYPDQQRVLCTTCPMTQDFRAERLNILFDADTGLIRQIRCG